MSRIGAIRMFCLICAVVQCCISASAQGYFLDRTDVTLEYVRNRANDGKIQWRHSMRCISVENTDKHVKYTTESVFSKENGKPLYKSGVIETTVVEKGTGDVSLDVGGAMASYIKARTGLNATSTGVLSNLPADIRPGDTLLPVVAQAKVGPLTYSVVIDNRIVLRNETVTVPAGTFDCIVISEHKIETGPGHNRDVTNVSWYSKGIGYVRHDTYVKGVLDTSEKLVSM